jgi:hypothetical protein
MTVCSEETPPTPRSYLENLTAPLPLGQKLRLLSRNVVRRLFPKPSTCCGHPGEPGC